MIGQPFAALPPLQEIPLADFSFQLPQRIRDPHTHFRYQKGPIRVCASEHQFYLHLLLPYHRGLFPRWWALRWLHEVEELEKRPAHQELFFQVCALDIRHCQHWVEIEYTFPLERFLTDAQMRAARDLAGLDLGLWERFVELEQLHPDHDDDDDAFIALMARLHVLVAERMIQPLLCGDVRDLKAVSSFVRADLQKIERFRSPSGFLELIFDQEVQQFLCDFDEMRLHGDAELAQDYLHDMLHRYPQHAALLELAAREALEQQAPKRALQALQRALHDDCFPRKDRLFLLRAKAYQMLEQDEEALQDLEQAILYNPAQMDAWLVRSDIFLQQGQWSRAQRCLDTLREQAPSWRGLHFQQALLAQQQDQLKEAMDAFRTEVEFHPNHLDAIDAVLALAQQLNDQPLLKLYSLKRRRLLQKQKQQHLRQTRQTQAFEDMDAFCCSYDAWLASDGQAWHVEEDEDVEEDAFLHDEDALHLFGLVDGHELFEESDEDFSGDDEDGAWLDEMAASEDGMVSQFVRATRNNPPTREPQPTLPPGCFEVDDAAFVRLGSFRYRGVGIAYEGATYRLSMILRKQDLPWEKLQALASRRDVARLLIEREGDEVILLLRLFPAPHLDLQQWMSQWGLDALPLLAEMMEPAEYRCSPSVRWDQLYRRLLAVMMDYVREALLRGDLLPLQEISSWLQGEKRDLEPQIPLSTGLAARKGTCSKTDPVALHFPQILEQLFAYTPANKPLSLGLDPSTLLDQSGRLTGLLTPHEESKLLPLEQLCLLVKQEPLEVLSRLGQYALQFRLSPDFYALKADALKSLLEQHTESIETSKIEQALQRAMLLRASF